MKGKEEHKLASENRIKKNLYGQSSELIGFYNALKIDGHTSSYRTHEEYINILLEFNEWIGKPIVQTTTLDLVNYMAKKLVNKFGEPSSPNSMVKIYSALKKFFEYLYNIDAIQKNPMDKINRPRPKPSDQITRVRLSKAESNKSIAKAKNDTHNQWNSRNTAIIALFLSTGMRCTALTEINIEDIHWTEKTVTVIDKENKLAVFTLQEDMCTLLKQYVEDRANLLKGYPDTEALFISKGRKRLDSSNVRDIINKYCSTDEKHITPHKLRYTYGSNALSSGLSIYEVQKLLHHASPNTTQLYATYDEEHMKKVEQQANSYLKLPV